MTGGGILTGVALFHGNKHIISKLWTLKMKRMKTLLIQT